MVGCAAAAAFDARRVVIAAPPHVCGVAPPHVRVVVGAVRQHYLTNPILRASGLMGELAQMEAERRLDRPMAAE